MAVTIDVTLLFPGHGRTPPTSTVCREQNDLPRLRRLCSAALAFSMLLRLKRYLKSAYGLTSAKCQSYRPSETTKVGKWSSPSPPPPPHAKPFPTLATFSNRVLSDMSWGTNRLLDVKNILIDILLWGFWFCEIIVCVCMCMPPTPLPSWIVAVRFI